MDLTYDPESGRYLSPYEIRMKTLASKDQLAQSQEPGAGVQDLSGSTPQSAKQIDWMGQSNLQQNKNVTGLEASQMEGKQVGSEGSDSGAASGAGAAAQSMQAGNNGASTVGAGMTSAGMASANPYLIAGGLALSALGSSQKKKDQERLNKYANELRKFEARQAAISKLSTMGSGLKA